MCPPASGVVRAGTAVRPMTVAAVRGLRRRVKTSSGRAHARGAWSGAHRSVRPRSAFRAAVAAAVLAFAGTPGTALASPPDNDNYLVATPLNQPNEPMPRDTVSSPVTDVSEATVQSDLFSPPSVGG